MLFCATQLLVQKNLELMLADVDLFIDKRLILINDVFTSKKSLQFSKMIWQLIGSKVIPMQIK